MNTKQPENTQTVTLKKGYGYWETTYYPYGGCFRRAAEDMEVELTDQKIKGDLKFYFTQNGKRLDGYSCPQAFSNWQPPTFD